MESFETAINCCNAALEIDVHSAKALFRRGKAWAGAGSLKEAEDDYAAAARLKPKSKEIREELRKLRGILFGARSGRAFEGRDRAGKRTPAARSSECQIQRGRRSWCQGRG